MLANNYNNTGTVHACTHVQWRLQLKLFTSILCDVSNPTGSEVVLDSHSSICMISNKNYTF